ncbi:MAG: HTTM domain-containing protein, partial [Candidatus Dadabacteria bacterium]|nr:HTTM domain-containing protein [Candidatus Dadabacteria bacterium]NIS09815.1 HTTM domain-containing protein [Candidatus Dadabacteria bacterium]NIV41171.1 HTTM domain-containing protein [Candidatus Dadabacteria bacterium]NIX16255.1 HTTM domain-containing protein [Candidatus Dadabacteria bacterium]NIY22876.1 HTTM domain-containing protein [Candidatus Dadabacteria bacterium]
MTNLFANILYSYPRLHRFLYEDTWAIPIDIFRILSGLLGLVYFISLYLEVKDFSSPQGLINHQFMLEQFWWLKINLIQPGVTDNFFYAILIIAMLGTLLLILGVRTRLVAALLFIIAACIQRWNFYVMYVDDAIMHLVFFWLILLPTGKSLNLIDYLRHGSEVIDKWKNQRVPGLAMRCLLINICWIYFFAGITKLTSPLWLNGTALYAILLLPISIAPDFWTPDHVPILKFCSYFSIFIEVSLPFLLVSRRGSYTKWLSMVFVLMLNLGIALTLKIPYANIALVASLVLFFRNELMQYLLNKKIIDEVAAGPKKLWTSQIIAAVFLVILIFSTLRDIPILEKLSYPTTRFLWLGGIAQNYYLFNWIDRLNYHYDQSITFTDALSGETENIDVNSILP